MHSSTHHLPLSWQRQVDYFSTLLKETYRPDKIILFGDYACGTYKEHRFFDKNNRQYEYTSDFQFLVILPQLADIGRATENWATHQKAMDHPILVIFLHTSDIRESLSQGWCFFHDVAQHGILLHDNSGDIFPAMEATATSNRQAQREKCISDLFPLAMDANQSAKTAWEKTELETCLSFLHKTAVLLYQLMLAAHMSYVPGTRDLVLLRRLCKPYSPALYFLFYPDNEGDQFLLALLNHGTIPGAAGFTQPPKKQDMQALMDKLADMEQIVLACCQPTQETTG